MTEKAGIGNKPDPTPGDREHPTEARRGDPRGFADAKAPEETGPERGAVKTGPSTGGAGRGGGERDTQPRGVEGGEGDWKNAGQGHGGGGPGRRFGNQPDVKEGDELSGAVPPKEKR